MVINLEEGWELRSHGKKMIAPIVAAVGVIVYFVVYFGFLMWLLPGVWKVLFGIFPLVFGALVVKVCIERILEIKKGEEDDLSQY